MGSCPDATLVFGVDLGDGERYSEEFGTVGPVVDHELDVDWFRAWANRFDDEDRDEDEDDPGYADAIIRALAVRSGWVDDLDGGVTDSTHVEEHLGVKLFTYGDYQWESCPHVLTAVDAALRIGTMNAGPVEVLPADLSPAGLADGAQKILNALALLGLTTTQQPCWLLVAEYG